MNEIDIERRISNRIQARYVRLSGAEHGFFILKDEDERVALTEAEAKKLVDFVLEDFEVSPLGPLPLPIKEKS